LEIDMASYNTLIRPKMGRGFLRTGLCIGLAGGLAELGVVWLYSALTGGDAAVIARHVASAIGLDGASATTGVTIHMGIAAVLGVALNAVVQIVAARLARDRVVFPVMLASLAIVWAINFFVLLPLLCPGFVHLLPYTVTLASKLAFGLAAAAAFRALPPAVWVPSAYGTGQAGVPDLAPGPAR
jgi:hypothetical protein